MKWVSFYLVCNLLVIFLVLYISFLLAVKMVHANTSVCFTSLLYENIVYLKLLNSGYLCILEQKQIYTQHLCPL